MLLCSLCILPRCAEIEEEDKDREDDELDCDSLLSSEPLDDDERDEET